MVAVDRRNQNNQIRNRRKKMKTFRDRNSVREYVNRLSEKIDMSGYDMSYDELVENATDCCIDYLKSKGFIYGQTDIEEIPISDGIWWSFFE
jgi:hypothetical protein